MALIAFDKPVKVLAYVLARQLGLFGEVGSAHLRLLCEVAVGKLQKSVSL
jgi:hypothetical protein